MSATNIIAAAIGNLIGFCCLWILAYYFWRPYRLDRIRDKLFQMRYELFSMAESREIDFYHPGYAMLRAQLNHMLRRAHRMTSMRLLLGPPPCSIKDPRQKWMESLEDLPQETRDKLIRIESQMATAIFAHTLTMSPFAAAIIAWCVIEHKRRAESFATRNYIVSAVSRDRCDLPDERPSSHGRRLATIG